MRCLYRTQRTSYRRAAWGKGGFTLTEMLVVIAIILILAGMLFAVGKSALEKSHQTKCASNLMNIGVALKQYRMDKKMYPRVNSATGEYGLWELVNNGYITSAAALGCPDDELDAVIKKDATTSKVVVDSATAANNSYSSYWRIDQNGDGPTATDALVWNYWGYDPKGWGYSTDPGTTYTNAMTAAGYLTSGSADPNKYPRMANRYAPDTTIVAHCVQHRKDYTAADPVSGDVDIILLLDGSVTKKDPYTLWKTTVSSGGNTATEWQSQKF